MYKIVHMEPIGSIKTPVDEVQLSYYQKILQSLISYRLLASCSLLLVIVSS